ncbi:MAG TPA: bifunctional protein-serine/threonine kinase/phosphatase [Chromatiales bacterium]|jgi:serine/threonine protein phosphatase PrpC|nr:bifunctional protein-serine/threonine kinase/phosphatase [Chromatiaceae bacterium]HIB83462.1 bifunctional protein-serine/threonine kinase/phosphatase [Chromatiaceae bacterium]HIO14254.1 bifunctional protein-serine/threonine kinase/phosphatase [Chromatiales bacterium]HIO54511.1 bifunctional protein-serine/threonine kinase/phosphatase [Chromatiales bacterium]
MGTPLTIQAGWYSDAGIKDSNDDACGFVSPKSSALESKGVAAVIADGMSGSEAGKEASNACVQGFLSDYFSTPDSWGTKSSGTKVLGALNQWLYTQGQDPHSGAQTMVTTLSTLVIKSTTAHIFHIGDTRIYRLRNGQLECLTKDHRVHISDEKNYLSRAMGIELQIDIDYRALPVEEGDIYLLTTDGIHDFLDDAELAEFLYPKTDSHETTTRAIAEKALELGSHDNVSCLILRVDTLPDANHSEFYQRLSELPFPPPLEPGMILDSYRIIREMHASKRTQIYLAEDQRTDQKVVLKTPSVNYEDDAEYIDRFLHEEWAGRRINNQHILHVLKPHAQRQCIYYVTEYIDGQTLREWMNDHPQASLKEVRSIAEQIAAGLRAMHRQEMIHQDLKPENIMLDQHGTVKIIDFGSTKIAGIEEITTPLARDNMLGTRNYTAPEYLQGYSGSSRSDLYSLGVIVYEMLTGQLPYGPNELTARRLRKARYISATSFNPEVPVWLDQALEKAASIARNDRYELLSELIHDLSHPNISLSQRRREPLLERNPLLFWKALSGVLLLLNLFLVFQLLNS